MYSVTHPYSPVRRLLLSPVKRPGNMHAEEFSNVPHGFYVIESGFKP